MTKLIVYGTETDRERLWDYFATHIIIPRPWWKRALSRWIPNFKERRISIGPVIELRPAPSVSSHTLLFYEEVEDDK